MSKNLIMNDVCRLCLAVPTEKMSTLSEESDIFGKIKNFLCLEISLDKSLPSQICTGCVNKIDDIHNYFKRVTENQKFLLKLARNNVNIKNATENNIEFISEENKSSLLDIEPIKCELSSSDEEALSRVKERKDVKSQQMKEKKASKFTNTTENRQYKCLICLKVFKSQKCVTKHYMEHERNTKNESKNDVTEKYKSGVLNDSQIFYECNICLKRFYKIRNILKHVDGHERPFVCKLCGRTYKSIYDIIRHGRAHNGHVFHCSHKCGFSSAYKGALKEHENRHGGPKFKFNCGKCGKGFQIKTWYEQHYNIHNGIKPFICDICGIAFHMDRYLTAHRSKMHPQTSELKRHVCIVCSMPCDTRISLKIHMKVHGVQSTLLCDLCGKVFTSYEQLKYHKNGHLGLKPYNCSICNKKFVRKSNLKMHELVHTGARAHVCTHCGKNFTQNSALRRHKRRHHTEDSNLQISN